MGSRKAKRWTRHPGLYRLEDGRVQVRVTVVDQRTGRQRERSQTLETNTSVSEALAVAHRLRTEAREGDRARRPTLSEYAGRYAARKIARGDWTLGSATESRVIRIYETQILPQLGALRVDQIRVADVQIWMDEQVIAFAPNTVRGRWGQLQAMLRAACAEYELPDPTRSVRAPRAPKRGGADVALLPQDVPRVLQATKDVAADWYPIVVLGFATGARPSELLAARVGDLALDYREDVGLWTVAQHLVDGHPIPGTKTSRDPEEVYLARTWCDELAPSVADRLPGEYLVSGGYARRPWRSAAGLTGALARISTACGLERLTAKVFRQTVATLGQLGGVAAALVQAHLRHASLASTDIYTRPQADQRIRAAKQLAEVVQIRGKKSGGSNE
jgi:integrase